MDQSSGNLNRRALLLQFLLLFSLWLSACDIQGCLPLKNCDRTFIFPESQFTSFLAVNCWRLLKTILNQRIKINNFQDLFLKIARATRWFRFFFSKTLTWVSFGTTPSSFFLLFFSSYGTSLVVYKVKGTLATLASTYFVSRMGWQEQESTMTSLPCSLFLSWVIIHFRHRCAAGMIRKALSMSWGWH